MERRYTRDFYADRHRRTAYSARTILSLVLDVLPPLRSAIDIGCGVGTWLSVLKEKGVSEICGLDGPWVDQDLLEIPRADFRTTDFDEAIVADKRYDLAICLEVAEHLPERSASKFVGSLVSASDRVLFSAAIPCQGGVGHVNEQWPEYWGRMFAARGYVALDFLRRKIWNDENIPFWYRQNVLMFVRRECLSAIIADGATASDDGLPIALVHPELYLAKFGRA
ncbi:MAG: methyltransferase domain-containing protein [Rhodocyclaceae bacterium]|nr:methyltransferase domain-containing protein [Rhodocyclaceae bacterium]